MSTSGYQTQTTRVIRDSVDWEREWSRIYSARTPIPPAPHIEFDTFSVAIVASGLKQTGGYDIQIVSAERERDRIILTVRETSPGESCNVAAGQSSPVDIALVSDTTSAVAFRWIYETLNCL